MAESELRKLFFRNVGQTSSAPLGLEIERAEGVFMYGPDGRRYIDLVSGVSVSNVGHCNPAVTRAVKDQVDRYSHLMVYGEMIESPQVEYASLLVSCLDSSLDCVYFVNSGSEANEAALKLAKRLTGRHTLVSCRNAYHGSTHGALSVMGGEEFKNSFRPLLPCVEHIRFGCMEDLEIVDSSVAAVIIEPVQGEGGVRMASLEYWKALRERCDRTGAVLIFDEVQTAFGRCGKLFGYELTGIVPDVITMAKALGGGMPLGALATSRERMSAWKSNPVLGHITTFGGHPVCCAAGLASLRYILDNRLADGAAAKGERYRAALEGHPLVKEIRVAGLLVAVDLGDADLIADLMPELLENGVMSDFFLFNGTSFRIAPPLVITDAEIDLSVEWIRRSLDAVAERRRIG